MTPSLSLTFEPPSTTAYGRSGSARTLRKHLDLGERPAGRRRAAAAAATSETLACLRCTTPKPSLTNSVAERRRARRRGRRARRRPCWSRARRSARSRAGRRRRRPSPATTAARRRPGDVGGERDRVRRAARRAARRPARARARASPRPWGGRGGPRGRRAHRASRSDVDGRQRRADAAVVGDATRAVAGVLERDVEVRPHEDPATGDVEVVDRLHDVVPLTGTCRRSTVRSTRRLRVAPLVVVPAEDLGRCCR